MGGKKKILNTRCVFFWSTMLYRGFCRGRKQKVLLVERNRKVSQRAFVKVDNYRKATLCNVGEHLKGCYVVDLIAEQSRQSFLSLCVCVCVREL